MGNLLQKTIASALCISFFMTQATFANLPTTGDVLKDVGTGGANIKNATEGFTGFENGGLLGLNKNEATLHFKGDAVINWNQLNVGGNQSLNFKNGDNIVLNNVLEGMSTFAGTITGQQGHIIISNPNGIMMQGGRFETSGALTLTTKDLSGLKDTDLRDNLQEKIEQAEYTNDYAVIVFKEGKANVVSATRDAKIEAGEINIIAKGINVSNADLFAKNGNVVFKTSNGADFVASTTNKKFDAETANKTFGTNFKDGNTIQVANASIKTPTGTIQFVTKDAGNISIASVKTPNSSYSFNTKNGNVSIVSANNSVKIANSNINGNLNVKGKLDVPSSWDDLWNLFKGNSDVLGDIEITDSKITGTSTLQTLGNIVIENCEKIGNLVAESTFRGIKVGNSDIKGNADFKVTGKTYDILPYYNIKEGKWIDSVYVAPKGGVVASNTNIGGTINLDVKNNANFSSPEGTLNFANPNVGGSLIANAKNISFKKDGSLTINDAFNAKYKLNATDKLSFKTDGDLIANSNNIGFGTANSTKFEGKNVNLKDITTNAINVVAKNGKIVAENVTAKAKNISNNIVAKFEGKKVISKNSNYQGETFVIADNAKFESNNNLTFANGSLVKKQFKADSAKDITINDMTCNNIQAKGKNVTLNKSGNLTVDNNINLVASEDVNVNADGILNVIESTIEGNNINLNANEIASTNAIYKGNIKMDSKGGITFNNNNSIAGTLTAKANNDINFRGITRADSDVTVDTTANATVHNVEVKNGTLAINNARNISVNNCSSDKLAIVNTPDNKFDYAEIYNTYAGTTEFGHGKYLYIDLTQSNLYRNNIKAILDNAYNVDKIVFNPMSAIYGQESSKNMNNLRAKGINVNIEQNFTPIAFAANENYKNSGLFKVAGDKVFKDLEKVVHITDKFILD